MAEHSAKTGVNLSNTAYNILRRVVEIVLPGLGTLYFTIAEIWGLPNATEVVGTIAAVTVFLALVLGLSRRVYNDVGKYDGAFVVDTSNEDKDVYNLELDVPFEELRDKDALQLKIHTQTHDQAPSQ